MIVLPRYVGKIAQAAASAQRGHGSRFSTHGVKVSLRPRGGWRLDATDGRLAVVIQGDAPDGPKLHSPDEQLLASIVPADDFARAFKEIPTSGWGGRIPAVAVELLEDSVELRPQGASSPIVSLPLEGRFPDIDGVIPKGFSPFKVTLGCDLLITLLQIVKAFGKDHDAAPSVEVYLFGPNKPVGFRASHPEGEMLDAILMPLTR